MRLHGWSWHRGLGVAATPAGVGLVAYPGSARPIGKGKMRGFGHLERDVMRTIWHAPGPVTGHEIADRMTTHSGLAYTTVITVIERLREKGYLERRRDGRAYRYHALITEEEHASALMEQVLDDADDRSGALLRFAGRLDPEEAEALRIALQQRQ